MFNSINNIISNAVDNILLQTGIKLRIQISELEIGCISDNQILEIIFQACNVWKTQYTEITQPNRKQKVVAKRQALSLLIYELYYDQKVSLKRMANITGLSDHSSFLHNLAEARSHLFAKDALFMGYWLQIKHLIDEAKTN